MKTNIQKPQNTAIKATGDNAGLILAKPFCASALSLSLANKMRQIIKRITIAILVFLSLCDVTYANIFFPASFYLEGRLLTGWMIGSALVIEFIILRVFLINNTARAIWGDLFMNGASALAGIVLIPFSGIILGVFAEKIDVSGMLYIGFTFILAVIINTVIERLILKEYFSVSFGLRENAIIFLANFLSVGVAGVSIILNPPKM